MGSLGTANTVLHGNALGPPVFGPIVAGDISAAFVTSVNVSGAGPLAFGNGPITHAGTITSLWTGSSGGILAFTAANTLVSSPTLRLNAVMLGGGVGAVPTALGTTGATSQVLHGNSAGAPVFAQITGPELALTTYNNTVSANIPISTTSSYVDGPTITQGSTGLFWVTGNISLRDAGITAATFRVKLWDGTNVIAACVAPEAILNGVTPISLSGWSRNPAGNLRISAQDLTSTNGSILSNNTGTSMDSTLYAVRVG